MSKSLIHAIDNGWSITINNTDISIGGKKQKTANWSAMIPDNMETITSSNLRYMDIIPISGEEAIKQVIRAIHNWEHRNVPWNLVSEVGQPPLEKARGISNTEIYQVKLEDGSTAFGSYTWEIYNDYFNWRVRDDRFEGMFRQARYFPCGDVVAWREINGVDYGKEEKM